LGRWSAAAAVRCGWCGGDDGLLQIVLARGAPTN
jgi:hypothetical protein